MHTQKGDNPMATQPFADVSADTATAASDFLRDYFTEKQLAHVLDRNTRTLRRWYAERTGPPRIRVGRKILYRKSAVSLWLAQNESRPDLWRRAGAAYTCSADKTPKNEGQLKIATNKEIHEENWVVVFNRIALSRERRMVAK
jgi:hypothetical protein